MSFKPEMQHSIDYYAAMAPDQRKREIKTMAELRKHFDHCLSAARRAEWQAKQGKAR